MNRRALDADLGPVEGHARLVLALMADTSALTAQLEEISALGLEAGNIPESVLQLLRGLVENIGDELTFSSPVPAAGATEHVVFLRLREGGEFDRVTAALRALRDERLAALQRAYIESVNVQRRIVERMERLTDRGASIRAA